VRTIEVQALPLMFRQWFELWATAKCLRRCDGETMVTVDGRAPETETACVCASELASGADERSCSPTTVLPCLVDIGLPRLAMWEVRATSFGTAGNLKGTMQLLGDEPPQRVPMLLSLNDRKVRDAADKVWDVTEIVATPLAAPGQQIEAPALDRPAPAALMDGNDNARVALLDEFDRMVDRMKAAGVYDLIREDWEHFRWNDETTPADIGDVARLRDWIEIVRATVADAEGT
ncbi:MAG: hypothetical protein R3324_08515, partial [Halobacteriales archaeon]|nr:hypothetical protein [Halobacteriales archaeon]